MKVTLRMQTPLWTGGVDGKSNRVQETGVLGSLRWWYEAIVRGLGGRACDPTTQRCRFDQQAFDRPTTNSITDWREALSHAGLCDGCQAYGATGWAQRFRLRVRGGETLDFDRALNVKPSGRRRGWYLLPGLVNSLNADVISRAHYHHAMLLVPLHLAADWGALGARGQHGYGVVKATVFEKRKRINLNEDMLTHLPVGNENSDHGLPSLRNMFFAKANFTAGSLKWWEQVDGLRHVDQRDEHKLKAWIDSGSVPVSPGVRNHLRFVDGLGIRGQGARNYIFGSSTPVCEKCYQEHCRHEAGRWERVKTKIFISSAYPIDKRKREWQIRVWGWLPHNIDPALKLNRENTLTALRERLGDREFWQRTLGSAIHFTALDWREFGAPSRDKTTGELERPLDFLAALLA